MLTLSATTVSSNDTFASSVYKDILVANTGSDDCFITLGSTATTADLLIKAGTTKVIGFTNLSTVAAICDTGKSTTLKILGVY